jgi:uncharacterized protein (DUF2336 family)
MLEVESRLTELENLLRRVPLSKRAALLKSITDFFVENVAHFGPAQMNLFDRLFGQLIVDIGKEAEATFARRLAPLGKAPVMTVNRLALDDDIAVAEPILMRSPCIEDAILIDIARAKGQTHLLAIACRPKIAEAVVDLLIARGDAVVVRYVANNRGARISGASAAALVERANNDDALAILVGARSDIAPDLLAMLPSRPRANAAA